MWESIIVVRKSNKLYGEIWCRFFDGVVVWMVHDTK